MLRCGRRPVDEELEVGILRMLMYFVSGPPWWPRRVVHAAGRLAGSSRAGLSKLRRSSQLSPRAPPLRIPLYHNTTSPLSPSQSTSLASSYDRHAAGVISTVPPHAPDSHYPCHYFHTWGSCSNRSSTPTNSCQSTSLRPVLSLWVSEHQRELDGAIPTALEFEERGRCYRRKHPVPCLRRSPSPQS